MIAFEDTSMSWLSFCALQLTLGRMGACFTVLDTRSKSMPQESRTHVIELFKPDIFMPIGEVDVSHPLLTNLLRLDWEQILLSSAEDELREPEADLSDGAFVDWTSGSTGGLPKGCVCTHETLANMYVQKWSDAHGFLSASDLKRVGYNLFFLWYWWHPLCHGGTSVILLDSELRDLSLFERAVAFHNIQGLDCITPSLLKVMCSFYPRNSQFPTTILVSGEALPTALCRQFLHRFNSHRLVNVFSTTETGDAAIAEVSAELVEQLESWGIESCPIGVVLHGADLVLRAIPAEEDYSVGELIVSKVGAREYLGDPVATTKGFSKEGWMSRDRVQKLPNDMLAITGRLDDCVKVRGFKIDLAAIQQAACQCDGVTDAVAVPNGDSVVLFLTSSVDLVDVPLVKAALESTLPSSHVPQVIQFVDSFPLTRTGKLDKKVLISSLQVRESSWEAEEVSVSVQRVLDAFAQVGLTQGPPDASFWDLGGTSLMAISVCHILGIPASAILEARTVSAVDLALFLESNDAVVSGKTAPRDRPSAGRGVAIIGMSGRWPGVGSAMTASELSHLLSGGLVHEYVPLSAPPQGGAGNIPGGFFLDESQIRGFDVSYFHQLTQSSASRIDPHQRLFAEMACESLIDAGVAGGADCGVFASSGSLSHFVELLLDEHETLAHIRESDPARYLDLELGCDKDYIALRTAKILNLRGPAVTVQAACASALVAVVQAVNAIRSGQCDLAVAGGVSLIIPQTAHASGLIWSQDGGCRPFDAKANGTANCNGGHCFVLKSLELAERDNDAIYGVIVGVGLNNDGSRGRDFVAPSITGHVQAISDALADAGMAATDVSMVEAHGTGTIVGDPMEYAALTQAYRKNGDGPVLSVGSVKGNVGHANTAAGALGLAKAATAVHAQTLFKSGSFETLNPHIAVVDSVRVQGITEPWTAVRRIAGVSSLGMGGTNCHVIVSQTSKGSVVDDSEIHDGSGLEFPIVLSGHSAASVTALLTETGKLFDRKKLWSEAELRDAAFTFANCRPHGRFRAIVSDLTHLSEMDMPRIVEAREAIKTIVLLFPGQGGALPELFAVDAEVVEILGLDPVAEFWKTKSGIWSQVALFAISYTVGKSVISSLPSGVHAVVCGHSIGEYAAACIAGMIDLKSALSLAKKRAELLVHYTGSGGMASVSADLAVVESAVVGTEVEIACINKTDRITVSGPKLAIDRLAADSGLVCKVLPTSGAFHSALCEPVAEELESFIAEQGIVFTKPLVGTTLVSTFTGGKINAVTSKHWGQHTRHRVEMVKALECIAGSFVDDSTVFVDVGPSIMMTQMASRPGRCVQSLTHATVPYQLWQLGLSVNLPVTGKRMLGLPTIGWDRVDCWPLAKPSRETTKTTQSAVAAKDMLISESWNAVAGTDCFVERKRKPFVVRLDADEAVNTAELMAAIFEEGRPGVVMFERYTEMLVFDLELPTVQARIALAAIAIVQQIAEARKVDRFIAVSVSFVVPDSVAYGALFGALRCAMSEHPDLSIALVRVYKDLVPLDPAVLFADKMIRPGEWLIDSKDPLVIKTRRISKLSTTKSTEPEFVIQANQSFVVTGGLGGIGSALVSWLLDAMAAHHVTILSRRRSDGAPMWPVEKVTILETDLDNSESVTSAVSGLSVDCVFHLAGSVHDSLVVDVNAEDVGVITSGKLNGLVALLRATEPRVPVIVFTTSSALFGSPGQCVYAAANAAVDAIAHYTQRVKSIQWGGWAASVKNSMSARFGLKPLEDCERYVSAETGFEAMQECMRLPQASVGVVDVYNWPLYCERTQLPGILLSDLYPSPDASWVVSVDQCVGPLAWLKDHTDESGEPLIPATALLGAMFSGPSTLTDVEFKEPLRLGRNLQVMSLAGTVCVESNKAGDDKRMHAVASVGDPAQCSNLRGKLVRRVEENASEWTPGDVVAMYDALTEGGFDYGPSFRLVKSAYLGDTGLVFGLVGGDPEGEQKFSGDGVYWEHARALDACTHLASLIDSRASSAFPSAVRAVSVSHDTNLFQQMRSHFKNVSGQEVKDTAWITVLRQSPLTAGPEFSTQVSVDVLAVSATTTVVMDRLVLTPVDSGEDDAVVALSLSSGGGIQRISPKVSEKKEGKSVPSQPFGVEIVGKLETRFVQLQATASRVKAGHVRIEVASYGLSFLDILAATGVMPPDLFGGEFAGTIVAIGEGVDLCVGARVTAVSSGGFASLIDIKAEFVQPIPAELSFDEAATIPVSVCTALFAIDRARVKKGDTVLVHNASGALGMAVIAILKQRFGNDVKIIGTCSAGKRTVVTALGASAIVDSRDVNSWPHLLDESVDASIGAMHPELLTATLPLMRSFGTIVDVGKRLQVENVAMGLAPFVRGLTYTTAHLDELMRVRPSAVNAILAEAVTSKITLPITRYDLIDLDSALTFLSTGKHVGKVVVSFPQLMLPAGDEWSPVIVDVQRFAGVANGLKSECQRVMQASLTRPVRVVDYSDGEELSVPWAGATLLLHPQLSAKQVTALLAQLPAVDERLVIVLPERVLVGPESVRKEFRDVRNSIMKSLETVGGVRQDERTWLEAAVSKAVGKSALSEKEITATLEQLGIDSLGRLQLWHSFRRQFPHSKFVSQFAPSASLQSMFVKRTETKKEVWLGIHGFRTSADVLQHQLADFVERMDDIEVKYVQAPHAARGPCPHDGPGFEWWSAQADKSYTDGWIGDVGLDQSVDALQRFVASNGPFVGVIGFSQGGGMAQYLVDAGLVSKAILFSPVAPRRDGWLADSRSTRCLVFKDLNDKSVEGFSTEGMQVIQHGEGHSIPKLTDSILETMNEWRTHI